MPSSANSVRTRAVAPVMEVFASIQGEGAYVGEPQVLLRLRGCPLRCRWCDTPGSWTLDGGTLAHVAAPGSPRREPGWATPFQAACWISEVEPGAPRTISVTGGEPLMWPEFLLGLRRVAGPRRLHLETAGAHPRALERVIEACDHVSLDLKLPADLDAPVPLESRPLDGDGDGDGPQGFEASPSDEGEWAQARASCLALLRGRDACAKLVVCGGRTPEDFEELIADLAGCAPGVPLYLQPATPMRGSAAPGPALLEALVELAREHGLTVRVVPQVHRALGLP